MFVDNKNTVLSISNEDDHSKYKLTECTFANNISPGHGTALGTFSPIPEIELIGCVFDSNRGISINIIGFQSVYTDYPGVTIKLTNFVDNSGSALYISSPVLNVLHLYSGELFQNNYADNGAALYLYGSSCLYIPNSSAIRFVNNTALFRGGAIYIDFSLEFDNCEFDVKSPNNETVAHFVNNSAGISGNDIYFRFHKLCNTSEINNKIQNSSYALNIFNYTQSDGAAATPPHKVNLCLPLKSPGESPCSCNFTKDSYFADEPNMLGHPIYFKAALCNYLMLLLERRKHFKIDCTNCSNTYKPLDSRLVLYDGEEMITIIGENITDSETNGT